MVRSETTGKEKYAVLYDGKIFIFDSRDFQDGHWITIGADEEEGRKGQHVFVRENGTIVYGLGGKFKNLRDLKKKQSGGGKDFILTKDDVANFINKGGDGARFMALADANYTGRYYSKKTINAEEVANFNPVKRFDKQPSEDEIVKNLGGADLTIGSCASLALAYTAQRGGYDVLDFRGGLSRRFFSSSENKAVLFGDCVVGTEHRTAQGAMRLMDKVLNNAPLGKEYLLATGRHMAVVRMEKDSNGNKVIKYLELQSKDSGWKDLGEPKSTQLRDMLHYRFAASLRNTSRTAGHESYLYDCDKLRESENFKVSLGFINTEKDKQEKGAGGGIK